MKVPQDNLQESKMQKFEESKMQNIPGTAYYFQVYTPETIYESLKMKFKTLNYVNGCASATSTEQQYQGSRACVCIGTVCMLTLNTSHAVKCQELVDL